MRPQHFANVLRMGRNSNQTGGQKEAKYKAKTLNSHDHLSHADMASKPCQACSGSHRAHTCAKKGSLKELAAGGGVTSLWPRAAAATPSAATLSVAAKVGSSSSSSSTTTTTTSATRTSSASVTNRESARRVLPSVFGACKRLRARMPDISGDPRHLSIPAGSALTVVTDFVRDLQMKSLCVSCPSPNYSFGAKPDLAVAECRDTIIYAVRWQLHDLTVRPLCRCGQELKGKRWSIAQVEGEVKRLVLEGGVRGYAFSWIMECPKADGRCETPDHNRQTYSSNEAYILRQVEEQCGRHLRRLYPVEYGYATRGGLFHFTEAYTRSLETLVVTHVPFSVLAENAKVAFRERYDEDAADFESHVAMYTRRRRLLFAPAEQPDGQFAPFPEFAAWIGREVPEGPTISAAYTTAWKTERRDERNIELQQVSLRASGDPASLDHTFATVKNVHAPLGLDPAVTAVFDMVNNKTGEVITAACVVGTSVGEAAHALSALTIKRGAKFSSVFSDNWPISEAPLALLLSFAHGRLDVLHWMKRMSKLLYEAHSEYAAALTALSAVRGIYWHTENMCTVICFVPNRWSSDGTWTTSRPLRRRCATGR